MTETEQAGVEQRKELLSCARGKRWQDRVRRLGLVTPQKQNFSLTALFRCLSWWLWSSFVQRQLNLSIPFKQVESVQVVSIQSIFLFYLFIVCMHLFIFLLIKRGSWTTQRMCMQAHESHDRVDHSATYKIIISHFKEMWIQYKAFKTITHWKRNTLVEFCFPQYQRWAILEHPLLRKSKDGWLCEVKGLIFKAVYYCHLRFCCLGCSCNFWGFFAINKITIINRILHCLEIGIFSFMK